MGPWQVDVKIALIIVLMGTKVGLDHVVLFFEWYILNKQLKRQGWSMGCKFMWLLFMSWVYGYKILPLWGVQMKWLVYFKLEKSQCDFSYLFFPQDRVKYKTMYCELVKFSGWGWGWGRGRGRGHGEVDPPTLGIGVICCSMCIMHFNAGRACFISILSIESTCAYQEK